MLTGSGRCKEQPDSFEHLLRCYDLTDQLKVGIEPSSFLLALATLPVASLPFVGDL